MINKSILYFPSTAPYSFISIPLAAFESILSMNHFLEVLQNWNILDSGDVSVCVGTNTPNVVLISNFSDSSQAFWHIQIIRIIMEITQIENLCTLQARMCREKCCLNIWRFTNWMNYFKATLEWPLLART